MAKNKPAKDMMNDVENKTNLVGYVRKSNAGGAVKVSINTDAFTAVSYTHLTLPTKA